MLEEPCPFYALLSFYSMRPFLIFLPLPGDHTGVWGGLERCFSDKEKSLVACRAGVPP